MDPRKDPSDDRDEFLARLDKIFDPMRGINVNECMEKIIMGDDTYKVNMQKRSAALGLEKKKYLDLYDAAQSKEDKMKVVASVKKGSL